MTKKQAIALGRKATAEFRRVCDENKDKPNAAILARKHAETIQEMEWFDIGLFHQTEEKARDFNNWYKGFLAGIKAARLEMDSKGLIQINPLGYPSQTKEGENQQ